MSDGEAFSLAGTYRVQSRRQGRHSELRGVWLSSDAILDSGTVNTALARHPAWRGNARVNLKVAHVNHRSGAFAAEPDILYKREFFAAANERSMESDIVDVEKSKTEWAARHIALAAIFDPDDLAAIYERLGELTPVIANEYYVHEAGHFIGIDVLDKYSSGYFWVQGRSLWPLIYAEELRADLGGFGFALDLLSAADAERIFLYNLALRFGAHRKAVEESGVEVYGLVPYLLFCVLSDLGFVRVESDRGRSKLRLASFSSTRIQEIMAAAAAHAHEELTAHEFTTTNATELALHVAQYVRRRQNDDARRRAFASVMTPPAKKQNGCYAG